MRASFRSVFPRSRRNSLLIFDGKIEESSFLRTQLGLTENSGLRIGSQDYREYLFARLNGVSDEFELAWSSELRDADVSSVRRWVESKFPNQAFATVVIYPAQVAFQDTDELSIALKKLSYVDECAQIATTPPIVAIPAAALGDPSLQRTPIIELGGALSLRMAGSSFNLERLADLFQVTRNFTHAREFNSFHVQNRYFVKSTSNAEKGEGEFRFLENLPIPLKPYYPVVGGHRRQNGRFEYDVEFLPMLDASRFFIQPTVPPRVFQRLLATLEEYLNACPREEVPVARYQSELRKLFVEKLRSRFAAFEARAAGTRVETFLQSGLGKPARELVEETIRELEQEIARSTATSLAFSHGDLCLSNILFDRSSGFVKLIDPKGDASSFLPTEYDLAKLSHSFLGGYDFVMNGLGRTELDRELRLQLTFETELDRLAEIQAIFSNWLHKRGSNLRFVRLAEASLFFSMLTLHSERPDRVIQQLLAGERALRSAARG